MNDRSQRPSSIAFIVFASASSTASALAISSAASAKGSTSELSIKRNGGDAVDQSKPLGQPMKMIEGPMVLRSVDVGMKKDEPALRSQLKFTPMP